MSSWCGRIMGFCFAVFLALWGAALSKSDEGFNITVLHTNDIHSHFLQSNKRGGSCTEKDLNKSACYGGVARIITKV
ncbi:secreted protein, putative [Ixodes scapularis]|uniref:Secreted protein, putative n=1 Tax=Ixodes scapularis TaxID=6945 RepID=B7QML0_IXOSC|nr:secreted protein, putative [Ixodes scapularis]|eukprot:XP_002399819.1 secreted protein, putative [Ixodes scapularis]